MNTCRLGFHEWNNWNQMFGIGSVVYVKTCRRCGHKQFAILTANFYNPEGEMRTIKAFEVINYCSTIGVHLGGSHSSYVLWEDKP